MCARDGKMTGGGWFSAGKYRFAADRYYDPVTHLWVLPVAEGRVRVGFDPLGIETCGDVVAVSFEADAELLDRGGCFGYLEAAKFVGPLLTPVAGRVVADNDAVTARPAALNEEPLRHWLVELELTGQEELDRLVSDPDEVRRSIERDIERFEREGLLAE